MKKCPHCLKELALDSFSKRKASTDGLNRLCKLCAKASYSDWKKQNPNYNKEYQAVRKEKLAEYYIKYRAENYEVIRSRNLRRRLREKAAGEPITAAVIRALWHKQKGLCMLCRTPIGSKPGEPWAYHVDHIIPVSRGGTNDPVNLQCLCPPCNNWKSNKLPEEAAQELGRLFL